jgi:hypothetical protein
VLHRDFKAENVLFRGDDVVVADFGFSVTLNSTTEFKATRLGTPHYMAPEILEYAPYNHRTDMWSLGILLYELMTSHRPFLGDTITELMESIKNDSPPDLRETSADKYSHEMYDLCDALLNKNPMNRPSALDMLRMDWLGHSDIDFSEVEDDAARQTAAWERISVTAKEPKSMVYELVHTAHNVNLRLRPSLDSPVVRILKLGDVLEQTGIPHKDGEEVTWMPTHDGFCMFTSPYLRDQRVTLFREVPEWRIRRPTAGTLAVAEPSPLSESGSMSTANELGESQAAAVLLEAHLFRHADEYVGHMLNFLTAHDLTRELVEWFISKHWQLATASDDMTWTVMCCKKLRPMRRVYCLRIVRAVALLVPRPRAAEAASNTLS